MTGTSIETLLDEIASHVIMADVSDEMSLKELVPLFNELNESLKEYGSEHVKGFAQECLTILNNINEKKPEDAEADLTEISDKISKLQRIMREYERSIRDDSRSLASEDDNSQTDTEDTSEDKILVEAEETSGSENAFELPAWVDEEVFRDFVSSHKFVLEEIEADVLDLERGEIKKRGELRRRIHTLKGEAGVLGLDDVEQVCHALEDFFDNCKSLEKCADTLLKIKDWIGCSIESYADMRLPEPRAEVIIAEFESSISAEASNPPVEDSEIDSSVPVDDEQNIQSDVEVSETETIERDEDTIELMGEFLQESDEGLAQADELLMNVEQNGADNDKVNAIFRVFHTIKGVSGFLEIDEITELAHTSETMLDQVREGQQVLEGGVLDLTFDAVALMRKMLERVRKAVEQSSDIAAHAELPELLNKLRTVIRRGDIEEEELPKAEPGMPLGLILTNMPDGIAQCDLDEALESQKKSGRKIGEELVATSSVAPKQVAQALRAQKRADQGGIQAKIRETVKVDLERVDSLVEMIGELVIVESMVVHHPEIASISTPKLRTYLSQLGKITRDLQDTGMRMRMVPVRGVFQKMARMVRDLSRKSGKQIKMVISGESTEMDRSMVERIGDPLVHMIRNAADHGIESKDERRKSGKEPIGKVMLSAYHEGGAIVIEISDNGKGLDKEAIVKKARTQGLLQDGEKLTDNEIYNLIFAPGFSTAKQVTEVSGRGVGMDVVKKNIDAMRGRVSISSVPGQGTSFKIILPLTLAIIEGMLVACGKEKYIIPTLSIIESLQPDPTMLITCAEKSELINVRGEVIPIVRLDRIFGIKDAEQEPSNGLIVIVEGVGQRIALLMDEVLTQQQVVIKSLGDGIGKTEFVSGAAILSDGRVGLILNIDELGSMMEERAKELRRRSAGGNGGSLEVFDIGSNNTPESNTDVPNVQKVLNEGEIAPPSPP
ncbi:MAG: hypothetical protein GY847_12965 [Proteobacteria bacterium]|nr:hypothetical protein [Pseudomonadota bacterium]